MLSWQAIKRTVELLFSKWYQLEMDIKLTIDPALSPAPVKLGLVVAQEIAPPFGAEPYPPFLKSAMEQAKEKGENLWPPKMKERVRSMLRYGKFRASGRAKPAVEFLFQAVQSDTMVSICTPVDINNAISLESGLPGSIFDLDRSGTEFLLRRGIPGESYIFNHAGQAIDLQDLLVICFKKGGLTTPCGNPIKDSMATKIQPETRHVAAVLYAPADESDERLLHYTKRFELLLCQFSMAKKSFTAIIS